MKETPDNRGERQIAEVFRSLADEYADQRYAADRRRAEHRMRTATHLFIDAQEPTRTFRLSPRRLIPAIAAAAVLAWVLSLWLLPTRLLEYTVEGGKLDQGVLRTFDGSARVRFSDESAIFANPRTHLQLEVVGERAALARLVKGDLRVAVHHTRDTDFRFLAGPYEVRVVGTKFDLAWDPDLAALSLVMKEGKVRVVGPNAFDRVLTAGERLDLGRSKQPPAAAAATEPEVSSNAPPARLAGRPEPPAPVGTTVGTSASRLSWTSLVSAGKFEDVVREAQADGLGKTHAERSAVDLRALAQAASYTGRADVAIKTWNVIRTRFRGRSAEQAAFFLGRIYDQHGKPGEALTWLRTYLREAPRGVYASEALGGVLTLVRRTEGNAAARPLARSYLERFPKGSYAAAARAVLDGQ
jgi:hypothetical protein